MKAIKPQDQEYYLIFTPGYSPSCYAIAQYVHHDWICDTTSNIINEHFVKIVKHLEA